MGAQQRVVIAQLTRYTYASVIQKSATATAGGEQLVAGWVVNDGLSDLALLGQGNGDGINRHAVYEVGGSVQGIDDPLKCGRFVGALLCRQVRTGLFTQKAMV